MHMWVVPGLTESLHVLHPPSVVLLIDKMDHRTGPIRICTGEYLRPMTGVFWRVNRAMCGSVPDRSAALNIALTVFMAHSTMPFD